MSPPFSDTPRKSLPLPLQISRLAARTDRPPARPCRALTSNQSSASGFNIPTLFANPNPSRPSRTLRAPKIAPPNQTTADANNLAPIKRSDTQPARSQLGIGRREQSRRGAGKQVDEWSRAQAPGGPKHADHVLSSAAQSGLAEVQARARLEQLVVGPGRRRDGQASGRSDTKSAAGQE